MRCPDCCKFVSMENGDPEVSGITAELSDGEIYVTAEAEVARNCADCGTELKRGTFYNLTATLTTDEIVEAAK